MSELCPFCGLDPYEYVHNGVGLQAVAINCCGWGIRLYEHGESREQLTALFVERYGHQPPKLHGEQDLSYDFGDEEVSEDESEGDDE